MFEDNLILCDRARRRIPANLRPLHPLDSAQSSKLTQDEPSKSSGASSSKTKIYYIVVFVIALRYGSNSASSEAPIHWTSVIVRNSPLHALLLDPLCLKVEIPESCFLFGSYGSTERVTASGKTLISKVFSLYGLDPFRQLDPNLTIISPRPNDCSGPTYSPHWPRSVILKANSSPNCFKSSSFVLVGCGLQSCKVATTSVWPISYHGKGLKKSLGWFSYGNFSLNQIYIDYKLFSEGSALRISLTTGLYLGPLLASYSESLSRTHDIASFWIIRTPIKQPQVRLVQSLTWPPTVSQPIECVWQVLDPCIKALQRILLVLEGLRFAINPFMEILLMQPSSFMERKSCSPLWREPFLHVCFS